MTPVSYTHLDVYKRQAQAIAKQVGIDTVIADVLPQEKASAIQKLQESSKVAFVGDGINDCLLYTSRCV